MENELKPTEIDNTQTENKSTTSPAVETEQETPEQINWKKFREAREIERKQKLEAEKRAAEKEAEVEAYKAAMDALLSKSSTNSVENGNRLADDDQELSEDEKIRKQVEAIILERDRKAEEEKRKLEIQAMPQRLQQSFQDFNQVCTSDNLDYLEYHYPEVAQAFSAMPEGFDKWASVYKAVKRFVPNTDSKREANKAEKNFQKPQAMSIPGKTQTGDNSPQHLDEKRKMDNWERMQRVMKGAK